MSLLNLSKFTGHAKTFFAWQIELTTRCPLKCRMCIREGAGRWHSKDMLLDNFKDISGYFSKAENIILQGWGEPLLYRNLIDAVRIVKEKGASAGFVTSGKGLNGNYIVELINAGVDFIGFSLAGATAKTHNSIRMNSDFEILLENIRFLNAVKKEKKIDKPRLHIVYLMLKDNIIDVPALVELAKYTGINDIILTNLIHVSNEWQEGQRVFSGRGRGVNEAHEEILQVAEAKAKKLKINLRQSSLSPVDVPVCEENPLRNLYISVDGEVSPCVYLYPPVPSPFKRIFCGNKFETEKASFGNIFRESFDIIWNSKEYAEFRGCFEKRLKNYKRLFPSGAENEPPVQCRTCHKMLGV
ncbi:MAG: SPASM domain-containing protein [Nitrospirae bacterium]|nr:SPASM domain-containing protein [Nitrospirota bacterium]